MSPSGRRRVAQTATGAVVLAVVLSACESIIEPADPDGEGGEGDSADAGDDDREPGDVQLSDVSAAVVQIVGEGTFVDPEQGELLNVPGSGSGFIIDPSGIAVTNNHVVTGAAFLDVFVDGDDQPRNARVLGVSECSDLAVIDIDGEGFTSLDWAPDVPSVGTEVVAAGYPLGDPEITYTQGIVSRDSRTEETEWASVDSVFLHDARINPGSSGGPLLDRTGRVVGVNYAGDAETEQFFAIAAAEAEPLVEQLVGETDVTTIGVNGQAFVLDDGTSGIWVSSVDSGSPAALTGLEGGDVITRVESLVVGDDGTMSDYCDVLRSNGPEDVLAIEVLRSATGELLAGQINGDELEVTQRFSNDLRAVAPGESGGETFDEYEQVSDDTGSITVSVPVEWTFRDGSGIDLDESTRWAALAVAPDGAAFDGSWAVPGAVITAGPDLAGVSTDVVLDTLGPGLTEGQCTLVGREPYDDGTYSGAFDLYESCGGTDTIFVSVAVTPPDGSFLVYIAMQATDDRDLDALDQFLGSFAISGV